MKWTQNDKVLNLLCSAFIGAEHENRHILEVLVTSPAAAVTDATVTSLVVTPAEMRRPRPAIIVVDVISRQSFSRLGSLCSGFRGFRSGCCYF